MWVMGAGIRWGRGVVISSRSGLLRVRPLGEIVGGQWMVEKRFLTDTCRFLDHYGQ